ncbi:MAG: Fe-S cluster assembly ATPase SufC [Acidimicrobiia bacterium]|nr:Fe-S cluster assembly ATPase SufC [Acidimicrobiia bacterium]
MSNALEVRDLSASVGDKQILKSLDLAIPFGEIHAIMGPNGSGKSTLCHVLTGKAGYEISGSASLDGTQILDKAVDERARLGLLQAFQYPVEIPGVELETLALEASEEREMAGAEVRILEAASRFGVEGFLRRGVNHDLSGGEKKRSEIFQISVLEPKVALLDEIDSGLDIDAVRRVAEAVEEMRSPKIGMLMITHYSRILEYVTPDRVHVMIDGRIVESGGPELALELEDGGYEGLKKRLGISAVRAPAATKGPSEFFTDTPFDG